MDPTLGSVLGVLMRWLHIASMAFAFGGALYARLVSAPALEALPADARASAGDAAAERLRPWILAAVFGLLVSGLYNLMTKRAYPDNYLLWFALKMLLALHIFAVSFLLTKPGVDAAKRTRWLTGIVFSGLVVLLISAYLRSLT
jgi:uncharacterized membrane protein